MSIARQYQAGFSLPMALFVLIVLGMLGAAMSRIVGQGQETVAREVVSMRALMAAESGAERALNQVLVIDPSVCTGTLASFNTLFGGTWALSGNGLAGCSAQVSCAVTLADGDQDSINESYFTIRSEGRCGPPTNPSIRIVEVQAR